MKNKDDITHIECVVTGKKCFVRPEVLAARIEKYGSLKNLKDTYICREALSLFKEGKTLEEVRAELSPKFKKDINSAAIKAIHEAQAQHKPKKTHEEPETHASSETHAAPKTKVIEDRFVFKPGKVIGFCAGKITDEESIKELTGNNTCWFPNIYQDNNGHCDGCSFFVHCLCSLKNLSKKAQKK